MLIKCVECGKGISDKSIACVNCGCPIEYSIRVEIEKNIYSLQLVSFENEADEIAKDLIEIFSMSDDEVIRKLENLPTFLFSDLEEEKALLLLEQIEVLPIKYNLYRNGNLVNRNAGEKKEVKLAFDTTDLTKPESPEQIAERNKREINRNRLIAVIIIILMVLYVCFQK